MRLISAAALALMTTACARPNYAPPATPTNTRAEAEGCHARFAVSGDCVSLRWEALTFGHRAYSSFVFKIGRPNAADGTLIVSDADDAESVEVIMSMPEMGHGTGPIDVDRLDTGTFRARAIQLDHGGLYLIRIIRHGGGRPDDEASMRRTL